MLIDWKDLTGKNQPDFRNLSGLAIWFGKFANLRAFFNFLHVIENLPKEKHIKILLIYINRYICGFNCE